VSSHHEHPASRPGGGDQPEPRRSAAEGAGGRGEPAESGGRGVEQAVSLLLEELRELARGDPRVADALSRLGRWLGEVAAARPRAGGTEAAGPSGARPDPGPPPEPAPAAAPTEPVRTVERVLSIGGQRIPLEVVDDGSPAPHADEAPRPAPPRSPRPSVPMSTVAARCRLKAECCEWAIERRRRVDDGADFDQAIKPTDQDLAERLRALPHCRGWPLDPYASLPGDRTLGDAAGCYRALADAVELAEQIYADEAVFEVHGQRAYALLAECCSALARVLIECDVEYDADQEDAFHWLRRRTFEDQIYVERHMRRSDPAPPERWPDRVDEIEALGERIAEDRGRAKERRNLLGRLDYIARRWEDYDEDETPVQAAKLDDAVARLVALGVRASDPRIRDPLLRVADELPDDLEPGGPLSEALRYADEYAARRESEGRPGPGAQAPLTGDVRRVRELLADQVVALVGGTCRPRSRDALRDALGLAELRWITTRPHEPVSHFLAQVRRPEVRLVILAIRWSSHSFSEIKAECDRAGKAFVRLPRGYGVNQVAKEIVAQASDALAAR